MVQRAVSTDVVGKCPKGKLENPTNVTLPNKVIVNLLLQLHSLFSHESASLRELLVVSGNFLPEVRYLFEAIQSHIRVTTLHRSGLNLRHDYILSAAKHFNLALIAKMKAFQM